MVDRVSDQMREHYCIQAKRIENMDKKLDTLTGHFQVGGVVVEMSGSIKKMVAVAEAVDKSRKNRENGGMPVKWLVLAVFGLVVILAALLGIKMPF